MPPKERPKVIEVDHQVILTLKGEMMAKAEGLQKAFESLQEKASFLGQPNSVVFGQGRPFREAIFELTYKLEGVESRLKDIPAENKAELGRFYREVKAYSLEDLESAEKELEDLKCIFGIRN